MINKSNRLTIVSILIATITLFGCCKTGVSISQDKDIVNDGMIPVSIFKALPMDLEISDWCWAGNSCLFFYDSKNWNEENKHVESRFYKWEMGAEVPKLLSAHTDQEQTIQCVFADSSDNIYFYGYVNESDVYKYFLKKCNSTGNQVWFVPMSSSAISALEGHYIPGGAVDGKGRICLYDYLGRIYLFDDQGRYIKCIDSQVNEGKELGSIEISLTPTGEGDIYGYYFKQAEGARDECLIMFQVDMENGGIGEKTSYAVEHNFAVKKVFAGNRNKVIYATANDLWEIDVDSGKIENFIELDGEYVNIDGHQILAIDPSDQGKIGIYLYDSLDKISEYAEISKQPAELYPAKEVITVGVTEETYGSQLDYFVRRYNRMNDHWKVEVVEYFPYTGKYDNILNEFTLDVLSGNAPDIIDAQSIPLKLLQGKAIFENLEPYFEQSRKVKQEDLLESVWRAGEQEGFMTFVMPWFILNTQAVKKEDLADRPWNLKTFLELLNENPETDIISYWSGSIRVQLLDFALEASSDLFYDDQKRKCYFMEQEFLSLLRGIKKIKEKENEKWLTYSADEISRFGEGEVIVLNYIIARMSELHYMNEMFGNDVEWVGYPSSQENCNLFRSFLMLGINSQSEKKEGAWLFLEYILSQEAQKWTDQEKSFFPVRKDAFDYYVEKSALGNKYSDSGLTFEEEYELIHNMVDNAYLKPFQVFSPVTNIIYEESQAYFAGDRSVEETAEIIQNRVMLFYHE